MKLPEREDFQANIVKQALLRKRNVRCINATMSTSLALARPEFSQALDLANEGKILKEICEAIGVTVPTLTQWLTEDVRFSALFHQARERGLHLLADSLVKLPDEYADVNKARLKSDNIKWLLARRLARQYGDRLDVNITGQIDLAGTLTEARSRILPQPMSNQAQIVDAQVIDAECETVTQPADAQSGDAEPSIFD